MKLSHNTVASSARMTNVVATTIASIPTGIQSRSRAPQRANPVMRCRPIACAECSIIERTTAGAASACRDDFDQFALAGIDFRMAKIPFGRDFLELNAHLAEIIDHLAHLRARQRVQIS